MLNRPRFRNIATPDLGAAAVQVRGFLEDRTGAKLAAPLLFGKWDEVMWAELPDGTQHLLWRKAPPPADPTRCAGKLLLPTYVS